MDHISEQLQHRFLARLLSPEETLNVIKHLRECDACREKLLALRSTKSASLADAILSETPNEEHPSADTLGAYLDDDLIHSDKVDVEAHLGTCELCQRALADLKSFRQELLQSPRREYTVGISPRSSASATSPLGSASDFLRDKLGFIAWFKQPLILAGTAAAAALIVAIGIIVVRSPFTSEIAGSGPSSQIKVVDGDHQIAVGANTIKNPSGALPKEQLAALNNLVSSVSSNQPLRLSQSVEDALNGLKRPPSVLLGQSPAKPPFHVISPNRTLISSVRPAFKWITAPGATAYIVHVIADNRSQEEIATSPAIPSSITDTNTCEWSIPESISLSPGARYRWYVTAIQKDQEIDAPGVEEPQAKFAVLSPGELDQLTTSKSEIGSDRLMDGLLNLKAGVLDDAQADFESLLAEPGQTSAGKDFLNRMIGEIGQLKE
jgi:anti-sigma factor RsiW